MNSPRILIVEDDVAAVKTYTVVLSRQGYQTITATTLTQAKEVAGAEEFDAALLDLRLPDGTTLDWIQDLRAAHPHAAIIIITGSGDIPTAVCAMKFGADNFLPKPVDMEELQVLLAKSLESAQFRRRNDVQKLLHQREDGPVFGSGKSIAYTLELAEIAAQDTAIVILQGETGTGKGVLARWIHDHGARSEEPFIELNCSMLKGDLLRSELFGHAKGSFTSAVSERPGLIESADRGTLFLDEIGEMDLEVQTQMLKVLEERTFRRIGENRVRTSDFRLICATNRDLLSAVEQGSFRRDLYYRINVFPIHIPALRERAEDIPALAQHLLKNIGYMHPLSPEIITTLTASQWDGNIRELRNVLERAKLLARGGLISVLHLGNFVRSEVAPALPTRWNLEEIEDELIVKAIEHFKEKTQAAQELGISISSLYRRLEKIQGPSPVTMQ